MNIKTDLPQIAALRDSIETHVGRSMKTHTDFVLLADVIDNQLREHVSETTLERLWGYSTRGYDTVSERTLTVLSRLIGFRDWAEFCESLREQSLRESDLFTADVLTADSLEPGTRLRIGWQPDRICIIKYLGNNRFMAESTENSTIQAGDSFSCLQFEKGRELYMDMFSRAGHEGEPSKSERYVVGQRNGLTTLEILK